MKKYGFAVLIFILIAGVCCLLLSCDVLDSGDGTDLRAHSLTIHPNNGQSAMTVTDVDSLRNIHYDGHSLVGVYLDSSCTRQVTVEEVGTLLSSRNVEVYLLWQEDSACAHQSVVIAAIPPTCTSQGTTEGARCVLCGAILVTPDILPALGHDYILHDAVSPTCTEDGHNAYRSCSRCDYTELEIISAKGHTIGEWVTDVDATCTTDGVCHAACEVCGTAFDNVVVEALGHDYVLHAGLPETCTEAGYYAYRTCSRCDYCDRVDVPAKGHTASDWVIDLAPTCTETGERHTVCTVCKVVLQRDVAPATGHTAGVWQVDIAATCAMRGTQHTACTVCGVTLETAEIASLGHAFIDHKAIAATCTEAGCKAYKTCSRCDYNDFEVIPAKGHVNSEWRTDSLPNCTMAGSRHVACLACGITLEVAAIDALGHEYVSHEGLDATCTEAGYTAYKTCTRCDYNDKTIIDSLGHTESDWKIDLAPTCTEQGSKYVECVRCRLTLDTAVVDALGHEYISHEGLDATCTEAGYAAYNTCSRCDYNDKVMIDPKGHTESNWIVDADATCTETGSQHIECTECGAEIERADIPSMGHIESEWQATLAPTCTEQGSKQKTCLRCGNVVATAVEDALGHSTGDWIVDSEVSCTEQGSKHKTCSRCQATVETSVTPALGHEYISHIGLDATCTEAGYTAYKTCSRCDYNDKEIIEPVGHTAGEWQIDLAPTCTETGSRHKACINCGVTVETEVIPAEGHSSDAWEIDVPATCVATGLGHAVCKVCHQAVQNIEIPALGHDYIEHEGLTPTCTVAGYTAYKTCSRCDYNDKEIIEPVGHTAGEWQIDLAPTCTETGSRHKACINCGVTIETATIPIGGHSYVTWVVDEPATCVATGLKHAVCEVCHQAVQNAEIPALGHDYISHDGLDATCTEAGYTAYKTCSRCDYNDKEMIEPVGHNAGDWIVDAPATCSEQGSQHIECTKCGAVLSSAVIPVTGHHNYVSSHYDATCIRYAYTAYECTVCHTVYQVTDPYATYMPHSYAGRLCTVCLRSQLEDYEAEFTAALEGNTRTNYYLIEADDTFNTYQKAALFIDWAIFYANTINKRVYFKPDVTLSSSSDMTTQWWKMLQYSCFTSAINASFYSSPYVYSLDLEAANTNATIYPAATTVNGVSYAIIEYPMQQSAERDSVVYAGGTPRAVDYDDFAYQGRSKAISVTTSDQLYYAFMNGYKPEPQAGSAAESMLAKAKDVMRQIVSDDMNDRQKLAAIYQWFINNIRYDYGATKSIYATSNDNSASKMTAYYLEGVFNYNRAVCDGISKAICVMAGLENIPCVRIAGYTDAYYTGGHAWNAVLVDGDQDGDKEWYLMDCTYAIPAFSLDGQRFTRGSYSYFLFTTTMRETDKYYSIYSNAPDIVADTVINPYTCFYRDDPADETVDYFFATQDELNEYFDYLYDTGLYKNKTTRAIYVNVYLDFVSDASQATTAITTAIKRWSVIPTISFSSYNVVGYKGKMVNVMLS